MSPMKVVNRTEFAGRCGTSLIELLVAMAIVAVLLAMLGEILAAVSGEWTRGSGRFTADVEGRAAVDALAQDLRAIEKKADGAEWLRIRSAGQGAIGSEFAIEFLARPIESGGATALVSYRNSVADPFGGDSLRPTLFRRVSDPDEAIGLLGAENLESAAQKFEADTIDEQWFLAGSVVETRVILVLRTPDGERLEFDGIDGITASIDVVAEGHSQLPAGSLIEAALVRVIVIEDQGIELLLSGAISREEATERFGHSYLREIEFTTHIPVIAYDDSE